MLVELIERHQRLVESNFGEESSQSIIQETRQVSFPYTFRKQQEEDNESLWDFGTIRQIITTKSSGPTTQPSLASFEWNSEHTPTGTIKSLKHVDSMRDISGYYPFNKRNVMKQIIEPVLEEMGSARSESLASLKRAFEDAEQDQPGVIQELVDRMLTKLNA